MYFQCGVKGINLFKEYQGMVKKKNPNILYSPTHNLSSTVGYFDGASMNGLCGCGVILMLNSDGLFRLSMRGGNGSNTRSQLLGLWGILKFDSLNDITSLYL